MKAVVLILLDQAAVGTALARRSDSRCKQRSYIQYTNTYKPIHTTSTKCQYHATASNAK